MKRLLRKLPIRWQRIIIDLLLDSILLQSLYNGMLLPLIRLWYRIVNPEKKLIEPSTPYLPPETPVKLTGRMWGILTYFNPAGYQTKLANFKLFRENIVETGLPLLAVELAYGDDQFELCEQDVENLIQVRSKDVLWQKERLLNLAIAALPSDCDRIVILDSDVIFQNQDWVSRTEKLLEIYSVVQPFSDYLLLEPGEVEYPIERAPVGRLEHQRYYSFARGIALHGVEVVQDYRLRGHTGFAWAFRRPVLDEIGIFDRLITGDGDLLLAYAVVNGCKTFPRDHFPLELTQQILEWGETLHERVQGSFTYTEGSLFHLWHGWQSNRRYGNRHQILIQEQFDAELDLKLDEQGIYEWASEKPDLHAWCHDYFVKRKEDYPITDRVQIKSHD